MIIGSVAIDIESGAIHTHRDSYLLNHLTVVSVRRPLIAFGVIFGAGMAGFGAMFGDLLFAHEIAVAAGFSGAALILGAQAGQLKLLSRDLRGSELSGVVWGRHAHLNAARREIMRALAATRKERL